MEHCFLESNTKLLFIIGKRLQWVNLGNIKMFTIAILPLDCRGGKAIFLKPYIIFYYV